MAAFLSEEWLAAEVDALGGLPERDGVDLNLEIKVADGPDGDVSVYQQVVGGRLVGAGHGKSPDSGATEVKASWDDALAIARGEADPHVWYMQGRTKLSGDMHALLIHLRPVTTSPEFVTGWGELMADTDC